MTTTEVHDVVVLGDGPAGLALASACHQRGLDVVVIGRGRPWGATYAAWIDELPEYADHFASTMSVDVVGHRRTSIARPYGVVDRPSLRARLDVAPRLEAEIVAVDHVLGGSVVRCSAGDRTGRIVVDARGSRADVGVAVQTAYGLVLDHRPSSIEGEQGVLMDWRPSGAGERARAEPPTFLYVIDLGEGRWLVEETSLAHRRAVPAAELRARLAARLGRDLTDRASAVEHVVIPMRPGVPASSGPTVLFGAAAGYVHPATGYSLAASLRSAPRVAAAIVEALPVADPLERSARIDDAVWPRAQRVTRSLHDAGLAALLRLSAEDVQSFFDLFFSLPADRWAAYLQVDAQPAEVARAMADVFRSASPRLRYRVAAGSPRPLLRVAASLLAR